MDVMLAGAEPITLAIGIGLAYAASLLLQPKNKGIVDDRPTGLATRGSFVPYVRGRRRVAHVFALATGRRRRKERAEGGKGVSLFGGPKTDIYYEKGLHVLAVGPIHSLHSIHESGKRIFSGPITQGSHPSGSTVGLGQTGSFRIYWGEPDQPIDTLLASSDGLGISSRFPHFCYIVWDEKRLGGSPQWPALDYVIEGRVQNTGLSLSDDYIQGPPQDPEGDPVDVDSVVNGVEGTGYISVEGYHADIFEIGESFVLSGNAADDTYTIFKVETLTGGFGISPITRVYPTGGLTGADTNGTIQASEFIPDDGVNLAHVIWEMLFADAPHGLALNTAEWDLDSLEALGQLMETEDLRGSVISQGDTVEATLVSILQDLGVQVPVNYETGLLEFVPMRKPEGSLPDIPVELIDKPLPDIEQVHGKKQMDSLIFAFQDGRINYRDNTIFIDDLGQAEQLEHKLYDEVRIESTVNFDTAALIGNRRELEVLTSKVKVKINALRDVRTLKPGDAITAIGTMAQVLRVWSVKIDPHSSKVTIEVTNDFYGVALDTFTNSPPDVTSDTQLAALDLASSILEVPAGLMPSLPDQAIVVPRIRAHDAISGAFIHLSQDGTTFQFSLDETNAAAGGTLVNELPATGRSRTSDITFNVLGPDIGNVQDLTLDEPNWRLGRQLMVIGDEIMHVRSVTALGGGVYQANDVLRGRNCTAKATHAADTPVFIFQITEISPIRDILLQPDTDIFVKAQPRAGDAVPLAGVPGVSKEPLHGEGRKPRDPANLQVTAPSTANRNVYYTGEDVSIRWSLCLPSTDAQGAGYIGAGNVVADSEIEGDFLIQWTTSGDTIVREDEVVNARDFTLTNAQLQTAFGSEPSTFKVKVTNRGLGLPSRTKEILVTLE